MDNSTFAHHFREALDQKHLKQIELIHYAEEHGVTELVV